MGYHSTLTVRPGLVSSLAIDRAVGLIYKLGLNLTMIGLCSPD